MAEADDHRRHAVYRAARTVLPSNTPGGGSLTVFVGLYNAEQYLDALLPQIEAQTLRDARWLFVDNSSSDGTWKRISDWVQTAGLDATVVRNPFNLGATGSIYVNLDLVETEWLAFMHQDDIYLPQHFATLAAATASAEPGTVGVFSDMGRADHNGKQVGSFPPPIWMVPSMDAPTVFLALLRNHCIPWPTLAVHLDEFRATEVPWHSTAFPDTEVTMRLATKGSFRHLETETMMYRDNEHSESRSIDDRERKFGATVSLFRVFNGSEFGMLARGLERGERPPFVSGLKSAILARLGDTERAYLVMVAALERLSMEWDNEEPAVLEELASLYAGLGARATSTLLNRMAHSSDEQSEIHADPGISASVLVQSGTGTLEAGHPGLARFVRSTYGRIGHRIPYHLRRALARAVIKPLTRGNPLSAWRFEWR